MSNIGIQSKLGVKASIFVELFRDLPPADRGFAQKWIDAAQLEKLATPLAKNSYGQYLLNLLKSH